MLFRSGGRDAEAQERAEAFVSRASELARLARSGLHGAPAADGYTQEFLMRLVTGTLVTLQEVGTLLRTSQDRGDKRKVYRKNPRTRFSEVGWDAAAGDSDDASFCDDCPLCAGAAAGRTKDHQEHFVRCTALQGEWRPRVERDVAEAAQWAELFGSVEGGVLFVGQIGRASCRERVCLAV